MKVEINNQKIDTELLQVPTMNYGQMQRWQDFVVLRYSIDMSVALFIKTFSTFFAEFREAEIEEDDTFDFPELIAFKNIGRPKLDELAQKHPIVFKDLIIYHQYEILHLITKRPEKSNSYYYSANSIDEVLLRQETIEFGGVCFKSDYVQHTYNYQQPREHALLK